MRLPLLVLLTPMAGACSFMTTTAAPEAGPIEAGSSSVDAAHPSDAGQQDSRPDAAQTDALPQGTCATNQDCGANETCSHLGICHPYACLGHADCDANERCLQRECLGRVASDHGVLFERYRPVALETHRSLIPSGDAPRQEDITGDFGFGGALFDLDGDHDLDLFVGVQSAHLEGSSPPCIFRNVSVGSMPAFEAIPAYCGRPMRDLSGGFGFDVEGDGFHELLVTGGQTIELWRFEPSFSITDLRALIPPENSRRSCNAGAAVNLDLNFDGRLDLVVACHNDGLIEHGASVKNLAFVQTNEGWMALDRGTWNRAQPILLEAESSTIALGAADLNDDGLLDLMVSEDYYTIPPNIDVDPGGIYFRCEPQSDCRFRPYRIGLGDHARGGYMGTGVLQVQGRGELVYFTDLGPNRLVEVNGERLRQWANSARVELAMNENVPLFSWGVVIDDLNRDGLDDIVVAQGAIKAMPFNEYALHYPAFLRQIEGGRFVTHSDDLGLQPYTPNDTGVEEVPFSGRALLRADLDQDGYIDLIEMGIEGRPRFHREVPPLATQSPRCTLIPKARYVPGFGVGHALLPPGGGAPRKWDSQGQLKSGTTPYLLSPWSQAELRFPSGAVVAFDCQDKPGPVVVEEPDWLNLTWQDQELTVSLGTAAPEGNLTVLAQPSNALLATASEGDGIYRVQLPEQTTRVMLRLGQRWLGRWWQP